MSAHKLSFPGKPIAKKRPRFARIGKFVRTYSDQETEESKFLWMAKQQWNISPLEGALSLDISFVMPIPKSMNKKTLALLQTGNLYHTKKPDLDNLIKFTKDIFTGLVWVDDSQVSVIVAKKIYGLSPGTEVMIQAI